MKLFLGVALLVLSGLYGKTLPIYKSQAFLLLMLAILGTGLLIWGFEESEI